MAIMNMAVNTTIAGNVGKGINFGEYSRHAAATAIGTSI